MVLIPFLTGCMFSGVLNTSGRNDVVPFGLGVSLSILLNGIATNLIKAAAGCLRPDFYFRFVLIFHFFYRLFAFLSKTVEIPASTFH